MVRFKKRGILRDCDKVENAIIKKIKKGEMVEAEDILGWYCTSHLDSVEREFRLLQKELTKVRKDMCIGKYSLLGEMRVAIKYKTSDERGITRKRVKQEFKKLRDVMTKIGKL